MTLHSSFSRCVLVAETVILASLLLVFSCAHSVLWIAWMAEHDDIERWYSQDGSDGRSYVSSLLDAGDTDGNNSSSVPASSFIMLLKQLSSLTVMEEESPCSPTGVTLRHHDTTGGEITAGIRRSIFHPPSVLV